MGVIVIPCFKMNEYILVFGSISQIISSRTIQTYMRAKKCQPRPWERVCRTSICLCSLELKNRSICVIKWPNQYTLEEHSEQRTMHSASEMVTITQVERLFSKYCNSDSENIFPHWNSG